MTNDEMSMGKHLEMEGMAEAAKDPGVLDLSLACPQDQILTLRDQDALMNPAVDVWKPEGQIGKPPLCRVYVRIGTLIVDACIESGATFLLLFERIYRQVQHECREMNPADDVQLHSANEHKIMLQG